ncbi:Ribophorin I, partial [Syncephalastrum racemosum]
LYKVTFDEPVQPNQEIRFGIKVSYTHVLEPFPAKAPQVSRQFLRYHGNVYHFSPYFSQEMKTTLQLISNNVVSFTGGENVKQNNNKITYGPFHDIGPESYQPLECHYEYPRPILTVTELERDLQLSHWANVLQVEENYKLHHAGAELESHFSRLQHQLSRMVHGQTSVLKDLTFKFPPNTRDIYYRDDIGNVSTSRVQHQQDSTVLVITPRYPLFGGWNYTWFHGYNTDLDQFDRYSKQTGEYILKVNLVENVYDMAIDKVETRIILPEGVTNVQVHAPFELDSIEHKTHFTNFDSTGRHMVVLRKYNVVREHEQPILVSHLFRSFVVVCRLTRCSRSPTNTPPSACCKSPSWLPQVSLLSSCSAPSSLS